MSLRPEELFVRDRLVVFLGGPERVQFSDGENPPDIYIVFDGVRHAVEISRLTPITIDHSGHIGNRMSDDVFGVRFCDDLDRSLGSMVHDGYSLLLVIRLPVENPNQFRDSVEHLLKDAVLLRGPISGRSSYKVMDSQLSVSWIPVQPSGKRIICIIENKNTNVDVLLNETVILQDRLIKKERRYAALNLSEPRWLALYNDYFLADLDTLKQAYQQCLTSHSFLRVFVVNFDGVVVEMHRDT